MMMQVTVAKLPEPDETQPQDSHKEEPQPQNSHMEKNNRTRTSKKTRHHHPFNKN